METDLDCGGAGGAKRLDLGFILEADLTGLLMHLTHREGKEESRMTPRLLP